MASNSSAKLLQHIHRQMNGLRNIGSFSTVEYKFIMERSSFDNMDDDDPLPPGDWLIIGRIFPKNRQIYRDQPVRIEIKLPSTYPGTPPEVRILSKIYHPNVNKNQQLCVPKLFSGSQYEPSMTLVQVVEEVTRVLDEPLTDMVQHDEAAILRSSQPAQYENKAREVFNENPTV